MRLHQYGAILIESGILWTYIKTSSRIYTLRDASAFGIYHNAINIHPVSITAHLAHITNYKSQIVYNLL